MRRHLSRERLTMRPLDSPPEYPQNSEEWDADVFSKATSFTVVFGRNPRTRKKFQYDDLEDAIMSALTFQSLDGQTAMVYAVTAEGRHTMLVRQKWDEYREIWNRKA